MKSCVMRPDLFWIDETLRIAARPSPLLSANALSVLVEDLIARLHHGEGVAIHCRARKLPVPDTPAQVNWVKHFATSMQGKK